MTASEIGLLLMSLLVLLRTLPAVRRQWREDRPGFYKTLRMMGFYALWCGFGLWLLFAVASPPGPDAVPPGKEGKSFAIAGLAIGWVGYGALWLIRLVPRYTTVPAWLLRPFGIPDLVLLGILAASVISILRA
ncbi:MAG: hypothetical protein AB7U38_02110 [Hyphomicrobiales bacterium]